jgi:cytochrome bd-type quinol oxidase subunit 2
MIIEAFIITVIPLFVYLIFASIEAGASLFLLWPRPLEHFSWGDFKVQGTVGKGSVLGAFAPYISPLWEVTNVFLVTFVVCVFTFFPKAVPVIAHQFLTLIFIIAVAFAVRIVGTLLLFYAEGLGRGAIALGKWCFFIGSFATLGLLGLLCFETLSGVGSGIAQGAWSFVVALWLMSLAIAFTFFRWYFAKPKSWRALGGLVLFLITLVFFKWVFFTFVAALWPYIVYPSVLATAAFTSPALAGIMFGSLIIGLILVVPALVILLYLMRRH